MAINKNHEFEDLEGIKCAIVERNATAERVAFLQDLLAFNKYTVVVVPAAAPRAASPAQALPVVETEPPQAPSLFTVGVTDVSFNPVNAIFGRLLKTIDGHVVTLAYWQQKETIAHDEIPYYEVKK